MNNSLQKIHDSSIKFLTPLNLKDTYTMIAVEAMSLVNGDYCSIFLSKKGVLKRVYTNHPVLSQIKPRRRGFTYSVYKTRTPRILNSKQISSIHPEFKKTKIKSDIVIPLANKGKSIGVLTITSKNKEFNQKDIQMLLLMGPLSSLALRKAQLYEELRTALKTRDLFISLASHELKTPIATAYTYLELLKRKMKKGEPPDPRWVDTVLEEMGRLTSLVNDLLEINQIRTGQLNYNWEPESIKRIIKRSIDNFHVKHKRRKVLIEDLIHGPNDQLISDRNKMIEVIFNLLDNAAKYSSPKTPIRVRLENRRKNILVSISDEGRGIPLTEIPKVFEGFYKGENNTVEGMGLGLFHSKQIIDKHKGKIKIDSQLKEGTTVTISLPQINYA